MKITSRYIEIPESASVPDTPAVGKGVLYAGTDSRIKLVQSSGDVETFGSTVAEFNDFDDVNLSSPQAGQLLRYRSGEWVNENLPSIPLNALDYDVVNEPEDSFWSGQTLYRRSDNVWNRWYFRPGNIINGLDNSNGIDLPGPSDGTFDRYIYNKDSNFSQTGDDELEIFGFHVVSNGDNAGGGSGGDFNAGPYIATLFIYFEPQMSYRYGAGITSAYQKADTIVQVSMNLLNNANGVEFSQEIFRTKVPEIGKGYQIIYPLNLDPYTSSSPANVKVVFSASKGNDLDVVRYWAYVTLEKAAMSPVATGVSVSSLN